MTDDERKAVVQRFYDEVVNGGAFDLVDELFSDDFVNHDQNPGFSPGREGIKELFRRLRTGFPDLVYRVDELLVAGEKVIDRGGRNRDADGVLRHPATERSPLRDEGNAHLYCARWPHRRAMGDRRRVEDASGPRDRPQLGNPNCRRSPSGLTTVMRWLATLM
ncbi:MAG: hypothetical protein KatS3mg060_1021 [Dehalococcoidia bacterium]|nr:MAG: hypothetical protein KatS3mg060_1021 [Dehalococcoidia bacterium]